ncbi:hypothetical protein EDC04DRAFT_2614335 [Pisolithus marmoratus]|nr:hypothetical protein EDC04DRAFT_2614335 [Pisolithus marmoratus]
MDYDPFEPFLPIIAALAGIISQCCVEIINQDMSSDNARVQWNDNEKGAHITFLLEQKCAGKMGDGAFKPAIMNAATVHLLQLFPNQRGPMKTREHCKRQMSSICVYPDHLITDQLIVAIQLKTILRDINQWHSTLGVHWDNVNRVKVGTEEENQVFKTWLQDHPTNSMHHFENCGWPHLEGMEELYPNDQVCGSHAYHPASQAITISDSTECGGVSAGSHCRKGLQLQGITPWVGSPSGTVMGGMSNDSFVEKPLNFINIRPQALPLPHPLIPPLASPAVFSSSALPMTTGAMRSSKKHSLRGVATNSSMPLRDLLSAQAALQAISVEDDGEWSSKRVRKGKDQSTQVALAAATQQIWTNKLQVALMMVEEQDKDLPIEAKVALIEAFHVDGSLQMLDAMLSSLPQTCT